MDEDKENIVSTRIPLPQHPLPAVPKHLLLAKKTGHAKNDTLRRPLKTINPQAFAMAGPSKPETVPRKPRVKIDTKHVTVRERCENSAWRYNVFQEKHVKDASIISISDDETCLEENNSVENKGRNNLGEPLTAVTALKARLEPKRVRNIKRILKRPHSRELHVLSPSPAAKQEKLEIEKRQLPFDEHLEERLQSPDYWKASYMVTDVFSNLLTIETKLLAVPRTFEVKGACLDYMSKINGAERNPATIQAACWFLDSILRKGRVQVNKHQLVAAACYWLVQKLRRKAAPALSLVECADRAITSDDMVAAEKTVLTGLVSMILASTQHTYIPNKMVLDIKSVLIVDGVGANCAEILQSHGIDSTSIANITKDDLLKEIPKYEALVVRSATRVTKDVLGAGTQLKVVGRAGAGVDNIDISTAGKMGIGVINAPGANALSACELTCSLVLNLSRHVVQAASSLKKGRWHRAKYTGTEVNGKTLAILGLGRVGREVALRMHAFGMKIIGYDPFVTAEQCAEFHTTKMELEEIWPLADYITLHTPLNESTKNLINFDVIEKCKRGVKIVNVGRGGLIHERDLLEALRCERVGGAALDVFEQEPPTDPITIALIQHPAVVATPHLGASTKEAQVRVGQEIAEQLVNLVKPGTYPTPLAEVTRVLKKVEQL